MKSKIRLVYLYLFSLIGLVIIVTGTISLINLGLKTYVFKEADREYYPRVLETPEGNEKIEYDEEQNRRSRIHREISQSLSQLIVGMPLYMYHWRLVQKESKIDVENNSD